MQPKRQAQHIGTSRSLPVSGLIVFVALLFAGGMAWAQELSVLGSFSNNSTSIPGYTPNSSLVEDAQGNFYGTTSWGGTNNGSTIAAGAVYKIAPDGTITILHSFGGTVPVGSNHAASASVSVVSSRGSTGTSTGGATADDSSGATLTVNGDTGGTLTLSGANTYTGSTIIASGTIFGTLYGGTTVLNAGGTFIGVLNGNSGTAGTVADGANPTGNLILGADGYLYGTTANGGPAGGGIVYKLSTSGDYSIIGMFTAGVTGASPNTGSAGFCPLGGVIQGKDGNLYGTTSQGGDSGLGVVFEIQPATATYSVIHDFATGGDAASPFTGLAQDAVGNLYGTTAEGGTAGLGTVYTIDTNHIFSVIYNFAAPSYTFTFNSSYGASKLGGYSPVSPLALGLDGNLYGTASGSTYGSGAAYKITPQGQLTILHYFGDGSVAGDGSVVGASVGEFTIFSIATNNVAKSPVAGDRLVVGTDGNFYGVTFVGGSVGKGTVFQMTPAGQVTIIHAFGDGTVGNDGANPVGLIEGTDGNFYGATNAGGAAGYGSVFKITTALPMFTSPLQVAATAGAPFTYHMAATQGPDTFTVTGLPTGFTFDGASVISSTSAPAGKYTVTMTATNAVGSNTVPLTITVISPPVITSLLDIVGSTTSIGYTILATQSPTSFTATGLPPGVGVDPVTGAFYGQPTQAGTYQVTISATNAVGTGTAVVNVTILSTSPTPDQEYMTIHNFQDGSVAGEGSYPGTMILGNDKTMYGVTAQGGVHGGGTIFKLSPSGASTIVASFGGATGFAPQGILQTTDGTLYGTTHSGGGTANAGTIFKVKPDGTITVLHTFGDGSVTNDGAKPQAGLVLGSDGNFYGTTQYGGSANQGTVFQMTPAGAVTTLHSFGDGSVTNDGAQPVAALITDPNPSTLETTQNGTTTQLYTSLTTLYGTTLQGGAQGVGTIFSITTTTGTVQVMHSFGDPTVSGDGQLPCSALTIVGQSGSGGISTPTSPVIYGTTTTGGSIGKGTIFSFSRLTLKMTILHSFGDNTVANDGENPSSALLVAPKPPTVPTIGGLTLSSVNGSPTPPIFYGTTQNGGTAGTGTAFRCDASGTTIVTTILHNFGDSAFPNDGTIPLGGICPGPDGNLYGTTIGGGTGSGTAYGIEIYQGYANSTSSQPFTCTGTIPAGMTFNAATGVLSGTPLQSDAMGVYSLTISSALLGTSSTQNLSIKLNQSFSSWTSAHTAAMTGIAGGSSGSTSTGTTTTNNATGTDNVPMVVKYLTGVNPNAPMKASDYAMLPSIGMDSTSQPGNSFLTLTWHQSVAATGVGVVLEATTDLVHWSPVTGTDLIAQPINTDSAGNQTMEMGVKMTGAAQQFIRLQVTPPAQ